MGSVMSSCDPGSLRDTAFVDELSANKDLCGIFPGSTDWIAVLTALVIAVDMASVIIGCTKLATIGFTAAIIMGCSLEATAVAISSVLPGDGRSMRPIRILPDFTSSLKLCALASAYDNCKPPG